LRWAAAEREAAEIATDQGRLRENVKAMGDRREARRRSEAERRILREEVDAVLRGLEGERR